MSMLGIDAAEVRVGLDGNLYVAPVGTAPPDDVDTAWGTGWIDLGYLSEDGITMTPGLTTEDIMAWQSLLPVRRLITERTLEWGFTLIQRNIETVKLAFGGGTWSEAVGPPQVFTYSPPAADYMDMRAFGLEVRDGSIIDRYTVGRGMITEVGDITVVRSGAVSFELTMSVLASGTGDPWTLITNDPNCDPTPTLLMAEGAEGGRAGVEPGETAPAPGGLIQGQVAATGQTSTGTRS